MTVGKENVQDRMLSRFPTQLLVAIFQIR